MKKKYSYIGIAFIILLFGIYTVPKVVDRFKADTTLEYLKTNEACLCLHLICILWLF